MLVPEWQTLEAEIARWRDAGRMVEFWWRDDDAVCRDTALLRLLELAARSGIPLAMAVTPDLAQGDLFDGLPPQVAVLQHGCDHINRASVGEEKSEFSAAEPRHVVLARLTAARLRLQAVAGPRALPVLVPPWNRIAVTLLRDLPGAGYVGISGWAGRRRLPAVIGLRQVDTHVDIIDWRGSRGFVGWERALAQAVHHLAARRMGDAPPQAAGPIGWLTHHLAHDAAAWDFLAQLFDATRRMAGVRWCHPADVFSGA